MTTTPYLDLDDATAVGQEVIDHLADVGRGNAALYRAQLAGVAPEPPRRRRRWWRRSPKAAGPVEHKEARPGLRGWRGPGRGENILVPQLDEFRATSRQLAGWWMFPVGVSSPMIGAVLGRNLLNGEPVCCDEIAWFQRAKLLSAPTMAVLARPGLGKSTLIRRKLIMQYRAGIIPLILGDLKPDYVALIRRLGGQVLTLGPGAGALNILDPGEAWAAAKRLTAAAAHAERHDDLPRVEMLLRLRDELMADARTRRKDGLASLITISRGEAPREREETILAVALQVLDGEWDYDQQSPVIADLLAVIRRAPQEVRDVALDRGDRAAYDRITEDLEASLLSLMTGGRLGDMFSRQTTEPMQRGKPVCFDLHLLRHASPAVKAAALITTWTYAFGAINAAHALADAGLEEQRIYAAVMDELWDALRVGHGMPGRVDALMRVNRTEACGVTLCTHSLGDLRALADDADREQARSLFEKAGVIICGGSAGGEMPLLASVAGFTRAEQALLTSWQDPPSWDPVAGTEGSAPGQGNFIIKIGERPGIPFHVVLTSKELGDINDTSARWHATPGHLAPEEVEEQPMLGLPPVPVTT